MKNFPLGGAMQFQSARRSSTLFNNVNYGNPNVVRSAAFGRISSAGTMRQMQLGGKLFF